MWGVVLTFGAQYGIIYTSMCAMAQQKGNKYYADDNTTPLYDTIPE